MRKLLQKGAKMAKKKIIIIDKESKANPFEVVFDLKEIENMAALGLTQEQIAIIKGISPETISRNKKKYEQLSQAIKVGKLTDMKNLFSAVRILAFGGPAKYDKDNNLLYPARSPNLSALKYLLNVIHQINERTGLDITSGGEPIKKVPIDQFVNLVNDKGKPKSE